MKKIIIQEPAQTVPGPVQMARELAQMVPGPVQMARELAQTDRLVTC